VRRSPQLRENSILCGIRWLGGIGENFRLTQIGVTPLDETVWVLTGGPFNVLYVEWGS